MFSINLLDIIFLVCKDLKDNLSSLLISEGISYISEKILKMIWDSFKNLIKNYGPISEKYMQALKYPHTCAYDFRQFMCHLMFTCEP